MCPLHVTTLNSSVCIRDDTDISQAFNTEVTTSMQLGFSTFSLRSASSDVLSRYSIV